jgi:hypothetical protein
MVNEMSGKLLPSVTTLAASSSHDIPGLNVLFFAVGSRSREHGKYRKNKHTFGCTGFSVCLILTRPPPRYGTTGTTGTNVLVFETSQHSCGDE